MYNEDHCNFQTGNGGMDNWSCERHGRDLWFLADDKVAVCVRFPNSRMADAADATGILVADDPVVLIRRRWLGGSPSDQGRIVCAQCSKSLEHWGTGRTLGVDCATRFTEPAVGDLSAWSAKWADRGARTTEIDMGLVLTKTSMIFEAKRHKGRRWLGARHRPRQEQNQPLKPGSYQGQVHEGVQNRDRNEQEQAHPGRRAQTQSPGQERIKQQQRAWADHWTPERARQAQAKAGNTT